MTMFGHLIPSLVRWTIRTEQPEAGPQTLLYLVHLHLHLPCVAISGADFPVSGVFTKNRRRINESFMTTRNERGVKTRCWIGNDKSMFFRHMTINSLLALSNKKSHRAALLGGPARIFRGFRGFYSTIPGIICDHSSVGD